MNCPTCSKEAEENSQFCGLCGTKLTLGETSMETEHSGGRYHDSESLTEKSSKSYVVSVCLAGIFGTLGVHHFYLSRWLHGTFDLALAVLTVSFLFIFWQLSVVTLIVDVTHTVYFMYKLIVGEYKDGKGRLVCIPS